MRKIVLMLLALMLPLAACGDDSTGPGETNITGTYTLQTVGGSPLPATLDQRGADRLQITAGRTTLNQDRTFSQSLTLRITQSGAVTTTEFPLNGTYTQNNNAIIFRYNDGEEAAGSISGNTLTITDEGLVFVFRK